MTGIAFSDYVEFTTPGVGDSKLGILVYDKDGNIIAACALGHALINAGIYKQNDTDTTHEVLVKRFPELNVNFDWLDYPTSFYAARKRALFWQVIYWYDFLNLSRAAIAQKLREKGL